MAKIRHTWSRAEEYKVDHFYRRRTCKRCGCVMDIGKYDHMNFFVCNRSGIVFKINELPECIDWNDNSLD